YCYPTRPATSQISTLSLHDALPIYACCSPAAAPDECASVPRTGRPASARAPGGQPLPHRPHRDLRPRMAAELVQDVLDVVGTTRSEEHTSELQSLRHLVCRLLLEKK